MSAGEGWIKTQLGEVATLVKGISYASEDYCGPGEGAVFITIKCVSKAGGFKREGIKYFKGTIASSQVLQPSELLIANTDLTRAGDIVGCPMLVPTINGETITMSMDLSKIVEDDAKVDRDFLYYMLMTDPVRRFMKDHASGSTVLHLQTRAVPGLELEIPTSKPEQTKIAEVLSTVDRAIEHTEALIAKQQRIKTGLMQDLLTRGIDEHGNLRSEQTHEFKDSPLGRIPVEWEVTDWGSVGYWKGGSTPSKGDPKNWINGRNLWVSPKDIRAPILETTEDLLTDRALTVSKLHVFQAGSIFTVFRSGILKHTIPISTCSKAFSVNQDIKVLIPKSETNIKFLKYLLSYCSPDILRKAVKVGTTVESIDRLVFEEMKIPCPDLPEQTRISDVLGQQESTSITLKSELLKLRSLKTAFMQDLLTGKKRVTTLLNDTEVASV